MHTYVRACVRVHVWTVENNFQDLALPSQESRDWTIVTRPSRKPLHLLGSLDPVIPYDPSILHLANASTWLKNGDFAECQSSRVSQGKELSWAFCLSSLVFLKRRGKKDTNPSPVTESPRMFA